MNISVPERPVVAEPSLEPYAQLLRALLPRMNSLSVFNALGELHWSTEISVEPALAALLPATIRKAEAEPAVNGEQCMAGSEPTYLFWLRRDDGAPVSTPFAVVAICFKPGNGDAGGHRRCLDGSDGDASGDRRRDVAASGNTVHRRR